MFLKKNYNYNIFKTLQLFFDFRKILFLARSLFLMQCLSNWQRFTPAINRHSLLRFRFVGLNEPLCKSKILFLNTKTSS